MSTESIFGHVSHTQEYNPPISQGDVMSLEADLSVRPTLDDVNPSTTTTFSSDRTTALLTTKLSTADVKDHAISTVETADQTVKSHVITEKTAFDADQQLVSKKYVDDNAGTPVPYSLPNTSSFAFGVNALANSTSTDSMAIGPGAMENTGTDNTIAIGTRAARNFSSSWSVFIGKDTGGRGGHLGGRHSNIYIGGQCGYSASGNRNIFIGRTVGWASSESNAFKLGIMTSLLLEGKIPTNASGANGEFQVNAPVVKLDPNLKTQADYASLASGQIYVDTSAGNVLKMK